MKLTRDDIRRAKIDVGERAFFFQTLRELVWQGAPVDIFTAEFSKVEQKEIEFLCIKGDVSISYSCSVGYDRQETYTEYSEISEKWVSKKRTVTDWQPYSGTNQSVEVAFCYAGKNIFDVFPDVEKSSYWEKVSCSVAAEADIELISEEEETKYAEVSKFSLDTAKQSLINSCYKKVKLPGNHQKDESVNGVVHIDMVEKFILPLYTMKIKYKDQTKIVTGYACTKNLKIGAEGKNPKIPFSEGEYAVKKIAKKKTMPIWICCGVLALVGMAGIVLEPLGGLFVLAGLIGIAGAIGVGIAGYKAYKKQQFKAEKILREEKEKGFKEYLKKMGLEEEYKNIQNEI